LNIRNLAAAATIALGLLPVSAVQADDNTTLLLSISGASAPSTGVTVESKSYNPLSGNPRWPAGGSTVEYTVVGAPIAGAVEAVDAAVATVDPYVTTRSFAHNEATTQTNPCRPGEPNTVRWGTVDGLGGLLAQTELCVTKSHDIVGFRTTFDIADGWAIGNDGSTATYDVQAVMTHEFVHVAGLDVVSKPGDACLTMYYKTNPEDIQQRTLGLGDKVGLDKLYNTGDTSPGPGCGL
jgi:hypothetical protein